MTAKEQRTRLQRILLGPEPQLLEEEARAGGLEEYGIGRAPADLSVLSGVEEAMLPRWWAFLYLTQGDIEKVCRTLAFSDVFLRELKRAQKLFEMPRAAGALELRRKLCRLTDEEEACYLDMNDTFALVDPLFISEKRELEGVLLREEAYREDMLHISGATLQALGVPAAHTSFILKVLLDAVVKAPQLNTFETLTRLAVFFWKGKAS
ncbi:MAG: hypothetical protein Q4G07_01040 [Oscillospiraceae bacterium]|nr:hypothetical protein [Oscillospiraceae bacterium]